MPTQTKTQKVVLVGRGNFTLRPDSYVTSGGEGAIYRIGDTVIKLYADKKKMQRDGMVDKIKLLHALKHEFVVAPEGVVTDQTGVPIGYHMPFASAEPMSRVFTNDFRQRESFGDKEAVIVAAHMRDTVLFAHKQGAIMVDANELNWLVALDKKRGPTPRVIDVDSWVVGGKIPAQVAKMPSIRDWHNPAVSVASDWFAWGVVSFQLLTGVHPYKGALAGYNPAEFLERMKANKSVFSPGVRLNRAVRDFSCIPTELLCWYEATFQNGERTVPPSPLKTGTTVPGAARTLRVVTTPTGSLVFEKLYAVTGRHVLRVWPSGIALLADGSLVELDMKKTIGNVTSKEVEVIRVDGGWLIATFADNRLYFTFISLATGKSEVLHSQLSGLGIFRSANRLFVRTEAGITEVGVMQFSKPILASLQTWGTLSGSTEWFDGVGVQDALGAKFLVIPFAQKSCAIQRAPELDAVRVIMAKSGPRFVVLTTLNRSGEYERLEFVFDCDYQGYTLSRHNVDGPELNLVILQKGVAASIVKDGELAIVVPTTGNTTIVSDKHVATDMLLGSIDDRVVYVLNGALWSLRMK